MVSFLIKDCTDCSSLDDTLCRIDEVLMKYGKNSWDNLSYLTSKAVPKLRIRRLLYYKEILLQLRWNQQFYRPYTITDIISKAKQLTNGL